MNSNEWLGVAICFGLAWPLSGRAATGAPAFQLVDLQKIVSLSDAKISPDGKQTWATPTCPC
jgi:hypothetical protein